MSNSVVFLLIAVGLSVLGAFAVWLHGRPRRSRSSVDMFNRSLQALAASDHQRREPLSGVTLRRLDEMDDLPVTAPPRAEVGEAENDGTFDDGTFDDGTGGAVGDAPASRSPRPSPRPARRTSPRPSAPRPSSPSHEGTHPGS